jgi:hypothetical protein
VPLWSITGTPPSACDRRFRQFCWLTHLTHRLVLRKAPAFIPAPESAYAQTNSTGAGFSLGLPEQFMVNGSVFSSYYLLPRYENDLNVSTDPALHCEKALPAAG